MILVDTTSSATAVSNTTISKSHTCTGANLLVVSIWYANGDNISSVTYGSKTLTLAVKKTNAGDYYSSIYYLQNPPQGSNTVTVTNSASNSIGFGVISFINTNPFPLSVIGVTGNVVDVFTKTVTTQKDNSYLIDAGYTGTLLGDDPGTPTSPQTQIFKTSFSNDMGMGSYKATTTAGSYTMSWSGTGRTGFSSYVVAEIFEGFGSGNALDLAGN